MTLRTVRSTAWLVFAGATLTSGMAFAEPAPDSRNDSDRGQSPIVMDLVQTTKSTKRSVGTEDLGKAVEAAQTPRVPVR